MSPGSKLATSKCSPQRLEPREYWGGGLIIAAPFSQDEDYVYDYGTALTRFSNGFMADPVKDFINFNWKLRQDVARVDNYKQATDNGQRQRRSEGGGVLGFA